MTARHPRPGHETTRNRGNGDSRTANRSALPAPELELGAWGDLLFRLKQATWRLREKPSFLIIGAQKAGTTSLYEYLLLHPGVRPVFYKEIHFFDIHFLRSESWYRAHFPLRRPLPGAKTAPLVGEATPYYMFHPLAAERAAGLYPDVKLICLLRNPVDRAFSHHTHNRRKGRETRPFEEAVRGEEDWLAAETQRLIDEPGHSSDRHRHFSYLARGVYVDQLRNWHRHFDRSALHVIDSGEFFRNTAKAIRETCAFLGLPELGQKAFEARNKQEYSAALKPETRERLAAWYAPHNARLYEYLGRDFGWG